MWSADLHDIVEADLSKVDNGHVVDREPRVFCVSTLTLFTRSCCILCPPNLIFCFAILILLFFSFSLFIWPVPRASCCRSSLTQNERGFQKQETIFLSRKGGLKKSESRFIRNPGLGFKVPREVSFSIHLNSRWSTISRSMIEVS